jgi:hypothetical protein
MSDYQRVIDAIQDNSLSWQDIDRIELDTATYDEFVERSSFETSNHATSSQPAVRETAGQEKIVYVTNGGIEVTIEL